VPDLSFLLTLIGTIGLILIVLEGSLELELNHQKRKLIEQSFILALLPMLLVAGILTIWFYQQEGGTVRNHLLNILPLCVISSAIAIPSARNFPNQEREFITYESSLSDILSVIFFNFVSINRTFDFTSAGYFLLDILLIPLISVAASLLLSALLSRIGHHVKFVPIILLVLLIYGIKKTLHLPGLLFILILGLFIGTIRQIAHLRRVRHFRPEELEVEAHKLREITGEGAFLVRASFIILSGSSSTTKALQTRHTFSFCFHRRCDTARACPLFRHFAPTNTPVALHCPAWTYHRPAVPLHSAFGSHL
jgi:hypothetical protein